MREPSLPFSCVQLQICCQEKKGGLYCSFHGFRNLKHKVLCDKELSPFVPHLSGLDHYSPFQTLLCLPCLLSFELLGSHCNNLSYTLQTLARAVFLRWYWLFFCCCSHQSETLSVGVSTPNIQPDITNHIYFLANTMKVMLLSDV